MKPPTLADARRAADRLADGHGVGQVLLYGSLARGEAREGSDIDLVAVFDDLGDYGERRSLWRMLRGTAEAVAGCPVDVRVTDRPEWRHRCKQVANSFERHIASEVVTLIDLPAGRVDWDKEIGMPSDEPSEIAAMLNGLGKEFESLSARLAPGINEQIAADPNERIAAVDPQAWEEDLAARRRGRHQALCGHATMSIELGLKALVLMGGTRPRKSHEPAELRTAMTQARWKLAQSIPEALLRDVRIWREAATYDDVLNDLELSNTELCELAERYIDAAVDFAALVIAEYEHTYPEYADPGRAVARLAQSVQTVQAERGRRNLWDGSETLDTPPPQKQPFLRRFGFLRRRTVPRARQPQFPQLPPPGPVAVCGHVGERSGTPCVLTRGHAGAHRYTR